MNKKIGLGLLVLLAFTAAAFGLEGQAGFESLNQSGESAKEATSQAIQAFKWFLAIIPIGPAVYSYGKTKAWIKQKEEDGRTQPEIARFGWLVVGTIGGFFATFLVYGLFGAILLNYNFYETWTSIVSDTWRALFGL